MKLLLDTCIVYDWLMDKLDDSDLVDLIQTSGAFVSAISVWEMTIKHGLGKMDLPSQNIADDIQAQGFDWLNITPYHAQAVIKLEHHHKDPFDRLLVAQAKTESLKIVTYDKIIVNYLDNTLLVRHSH